MTDHCPTCRQEAEHIIALDVALGNLRVKARVHRSILAVILRYTSAAEKAANLHRDHLRREHRDTIRVLADHLPAHADRRGA